MLVEAARSSHRACHEACTTHNTHHVHLHRCAYSGPLLGLDLDNSHVRPGDPRVVTLERRRLES